MGVYQKYGRNIGTLRNKVLDHDLSIDALESHERLKMVLPYEIKMNWQGVLVSYTIVLAQFRVYYTIFYLLESATVWLKKIEGLQTEIASQSGRERGGW